MRPPAKFPIWILAAGCVLVIVFTLRRKPLPVYSRVNDFTLTNQHNTAVTLADLRGHAWIGDIIFTRCPGPCARMTRNLRELQDALASSRNLRFVTLTTDPNYDTPAVLARYAHTFGADTNRWLFLTGTKKQIADLAIDGLKLTSIEKKPDERENSNDLFVHSTIFVVVDKQGQLRGVFETTGEEISWPQQKEKILEAARHWEQEP